MNRRTTVFTLLLATAPLSLPTAMATQSLLPQPFEATYAATYNDMNVTATRSLAEHAGGCEYRFSAKSWIASMEEQSQFHWNEEGQYVPRNYHYQRNVMGSRRQTQQSFDWQSGKVSYSVDRKSGQLDLPERALDKLGYQLQLRRDLLNGADALHYSVVDGRRLKNYEFAIVGEEVLHTSAGKLNTVKVKRVREGADRATILWMASDWDYLLVRMQQYEDGALDFEINLSAASVGGKTLRGR